MTKKSPAKRTAKQANSPTIKSLLAKAETVKGKLCPSQVLTANDRATAEYFCRKYLNGDFAHLSWNKSTLHRFLVKNIPTFKFKWHGFRLFLQAVTDEEEAKSQSS